MVGALGATMNAVLDVLAPLGITTLDMPAMPQRLWAAIRQAKRGTTRSPPQAGNPHGARCNRHAIGYIILRYDDKSIERGDRTGRILA
jgi:hypothetical protein